MADIKTLYPQTYYTINPASPLFLKGLIYEVKKRQDVRRILAWVRRFGIRSILDIGCGDVEKLVSLRKNLSGLPVRLLGIDLQFSQVIKDKARAHGIVLLEANIDDYEFPPEFEKVDFILVSQLMEHLVAPDRVLDKLSQILHPQGKMLIETPNSGGLDFVLFHRRHWGGYHIPRHFNIFNPQGLASFVRRFGFKPLEQGFLSSPGFWIMSLRNQLGLNSIQRSGSFWEFLSFHNIWVVTLFVLIDTLSIKLHQPTSNQFLLAEKIL